MLHTVCVCVCVCDTDTVGGCVGVGVLSWSTQRTEGMGHTRIM